jgi:hypothetical protein
MLIKFRVRPFQILPDTYRTSRVRQNHKSVTVPANKTQCQEVNWTSFRKTLPNKLSKSGNVFHMQARYHFQSKTEHLRSFFPRPLYVHAAQWRRQRPRPAQSLPLRRLQVPYAPIRCKISCVIDIYIVPTPRANYLRPCKNIKDCCPGARHVHNVTLSKGTDDTSSNPGRDKILPLFQIIQTSSAPPPPPPPPAFYSTRTGRSFLRGKASKHEADHPAPSCGKVINERSYTSTPLVVCRNTGTNLRISQPVCSHQLNWLTVSKAHLIWLCIIVCLTAAV